MIPRQTLLDAALQGDQYAQGELLESFRPYIKVLSRAVRNGRVPSRFGDSDLVQDALLEAHRGFSNFRGTTVEEFTGWLRQVVLGCVGHVLRAQLATAKRNAGREHQEELITAQWADSGTSPSAQAIRQEQAVLLADAISTLPEEMQQVLLGRYLDELPYAQLAETLGRSEAAVRMLYLRALRRLREAYQEAP